MLFQYPMVILIVNSRKWNRDECLKKLEVDGSKKIIVSIGFYNEQKNQQLLIQPISLLPQRIKDNLIRYIIGEDRCGGIRDASRAILLGTGDPYYRAS